MTFKELRKLKKSLPSNGVKALAQKFNRSENYIRMILRGERQNYSILNEAIKIAEEEKKRKQELSEKVKCL